MFCDKQIYRCDGRDIVGVKYIGDYMGNTLMPMYKLTLDDGSYRVYYYFRKEARGGLGSVVLATFDGYKEI